ncbi:MAG: hypothetical protein KC457_01785, partial [Myxococcales bacterium]|nr:hypothetical protein [Myxococcales bacterium]
MTDTPPDKSSKRPPRAGRRLKRGHKAEAEAQATAQAQAVAAAQAAAAAQGQAPARKRAVKAVRQLDPETFRNVDLMIGSYAQRQFKQLMPKVAQGFFAPLGDKAAELSKRSDLQQAFALFFVYGFRDSAGRRVIDMFGQSGLKLDREQTRVFEALERTKLVVFAIQSMNPANKQMAGRDALREMPITALDHNLFQKVKPGDVALAYMFPVGDMWRPLGMATMVPRAKVNLFDQGLGRLAREQGLAAAQLGEARPAQLFWLAYRTAEAV